MTEDLPYRPVSNKGVLRAWLAERVLAAHESGRVRTVIGRAAELYGPAVESLPGSNIFGPAARGGLALWIGELDQPMTPMFIDDFAHGLDSSKYRTAFGPGRITPYEHGIDRTVDWYRATPRGGITILGR